MFKLEQHGWKRQNYKIKDEREKETKARASQERYEKLCQDCFLCAAIRWTRLSVILGHKKRKKVVVNCLSYRLFGSVLCFGSYLAGSRLTDRLFSWKGGRFTLRTLTLFLVLIPLSPSFLLSSD